MTGLFDWVRTRALAYPDTCEEAPWGSRAFKVARKVFVFSGEGEGRVTLSLKLPQSKDEALEYDFATPTHYGMGKHGWVTLGFEGDIEVPYEALERWLDESFRCIAPKRLLKGVPAGGPPPPSPPEAPPEPLADLGGPVLLAGADPLRLARAARWLEARGLPLEQHASVDEDLIAVFAETAPAVLVMDLGPQTEKAIQLAEVLREAGAPLALAGVRDKKMEVRLARAFPGVPTSRAAPGESAYLDALYRDFSDPPHPGGPSR